MDKLSCLQAFIGVVESGSFSETARRNSVSKAQISKQVGQLEESLGVRLLHRTTRQVSPTSSGQAYYEQCKPLLVELADLDQSIQSSQKDLQGELRVSAPVTFAEMHLMPIISTFARSYPEVKIQLELTDRFVNLVEDRVDLAIRIGELQEQTLVSRRIGSTRMMLFTSPEYLRSHPVPEALEQLAQHDCILDTNYPGADQWSLMLAGETVSARVNVHIQVNNARAALELVLAGNGIGFLPSFALDKYIKDGSLLAVLPEYVAEPIGIYAVYLHRKHLSAKVRRLLDTLITHLQ
jgi:DNA-binding transcriptional LysR family regulator